MTVIFVEQQNPNASDTYVTHVTIYIFNVIVEPTMIVFLSRINGWVFVKGEVVFSFRMRILK